MIEIRKNFLTVMLGVVQIYMWATTYYLPAILVDIVATDLQWGNLETMGAFSWALLVAGVSSPIIGGWIEKSGGRLPLIAGSITTAFGLIVLSLSTERFTWYAGWTMIGLGMSLGLFNAIFAALGAAFGQTAKKTIIKVTLISGFATFFWPVTAYVIEAIGWRATLLVYAIPHVFIIAPLYFFNFPKTISTHVHQEQPMPIVGKSAILIIGLLATFAILRTFLATTCSVYMISLFEKIGISIGLAAFIAALIGPAQILARLIELKFGEKFDPIKSSILWAIMLPIAFAILLIGSLGSTVIFSILYGMSNGMVTITMSILPMVLFGSKGYAKLMGKLAFPILLMQAASPILAIPIIDSYSVDEIFMFAGIVSILAVFCLLALQILHKTVRVAHLSEVKSKISGGNYDQ